MLCAVMCEQLNSGMVPMFILPSLKRFTGVWKQAQSGTAAEK
jgi:hypothetical protein